MTRLKFVLIFFLFFFVDFINSFRGIFLVGGQVYGAEFWLSDCKCSSSCCLTSLFSSCICFWSIQLKCEQFDKVQFFPILFLKLLLWLFQALEHELLEWWRWGAQGSAHRRRGLYPTIYRKRFRGWVNKSNTQVHNAAYTQCIGIQPTWRAAGWFFMQSLHAKRFETRPRILLRAQAENKLVLRNRVARFRQIHLQSSTNAKRQEHAGCGWIGLGTIVVTTWQATDLRCANCKTNITKCNAMQSNCNVMNVQIPKHNAHYFLLNQNQNFCTLITAWVICSSWKSDCVLC